MMPTAPPRMRSSRVTCIVGPRATAAHGYSSAPWLRHALSTSQSSLKLRFRDRLAALPEQRRRVEDHSAILEAAVVSSAASITLGLPVQAPPRSPGLASPCRTPRDRRLRPGESVPKPSVFRCEGNRGWPVAQDCGAACGEHGHAGQPANDVSARPTRLGLDTSPMTAVWLSRRHNAVEPTGPAAHASPPDRATSSELAMCVAEPAALNR